MSAILIQPIHPRRVAQLVLASIVSLACLLPTAHTVGAQGGPDTRWTTFSAADGLADNSINDILVTKDESLWFATRRGISRYDGLTWTTFTEGDGLPTRSVDLLYEDTTGVIWAGTVEGLYRYVLPEGEEQKAWIPVELDDVFEQDAVVAISGDAEGGLWVGIWFGGVGYFDGEHWQKHASEGGLLQVYDLQVEQDGTLWVATDVGVSHFDGQVWETFSFSDGIPPSSRVLTILEDRQGNIWAGTWSGGASRYDGEVWRTFTTADGLIDNTVHAIAEDETGALWFGTSKGVSRYDGRAWHTFTPDNSGLAGEHVSEIVADRYGALWFDVGDNGVSRYDPSSWWSFAYDYDLASNDVRTLAAAQDGTMWIGTSAGLTRYASPAEEKMETRFQSYTAADGLAGTSITSLLVDQLGAVWVGTWGEGVSAYDGVHWRTFTTLDGLALNIVTALSEDRAGDIWVGTARGISRYDGRRWTLYDLADGEEIGHVHAVVEGPSGDLWAGAGRLLRYDGLTWHIVPGDDAPAGIRTLTFDAGGDLWVGTHDGAGRFDGASWQTFTTADGLTGDRVTALLADSSGALWVGTRDGTSRYDGETWQSFTTADGLAGDRIQAIAEDNLGQIWVGTDRGLSLYDQGEWRRYSPQDRPASDSIESIWHDADGNWWFGTRAGLSRYDGERWETITTDRVFDILQHPSGDLLFLWDDGITRYDGSTFDHFEWIEEAGGEPLTYAYDSNGILWKILKDGGREYADQRWANYVATRPPGYTFFEDERIGEILIDRAGTLWVVPESGGIGNGLIRFDDETQVMFTTADGLASNDVQALLEDASGTIWVGTYRGGVSRHDGETWRTFTPENSGLSGSVSSLWEDEEGRIWMGTNQWYSIYRGDSLSPPTITGLFDLDGEELTLPLKHNQNSFLIELSAAVPYARTRDVRYRYWLDGVDHDWQFAHPPSNRSTQVQVPYYGLVPGTYTLHVAVGNLNLDYSEEGRYTFTILSAPPSVSLEAVAVDEYTDIESPAEVTAPKLWFKRSHRLTFRVAGSDDSPSGEPATFYYRLEGDGETRTGEFETDDELPAEQLDPGEYTLTVWAVDEEGNQSEVDQSLISIPRPRYQTDWPQWLGLIAAFAGVAVGGGLGYRFLRSLHAFRYRDVEVVVSPGPTAEAWQVRFRVPRAKDSPSFEQSFNPSLLREPLVRLEQERTDELHLRYVGESLYRGLFSTEATAYLKRRYNLGRRPLRLRLYFEDAPELTALPWELMHGGEDIGFLGQRADTALVRYKPAGEFQRPIVGKQLRVLVVMAQPADERIEQLALAKEKARLDEILGEITQVELDYLFGVHAAEVIGAEAAARDLPDQLAERLAEDWDVLHFVGHAGQDLIPLGEKDEIVLWCEDRRGDYLALGPQELETMLRGLASEGKAPKLVVLNACRTADVGGRLTTTMLESGVGAVVGMQWPVLDVAARAFAAGFYDTLVRHGQVDYGVSVARNRMAQEVGPGRRDWAAPVLVMQVQDGFLFERL